MTTAGWLILASMFFGFIFGYGFAKSAEFEAMLMEYYRSKKGPVTCAPAVKPSAKTLRERLGWKKTSNAQQEANLNHNINGMVAENREAEITLTIPDGFQLNGLEPGTKVKVSFSKYDASLPPVFMGDEQNKVSFKMSSYSEEKK